MVRPFASRDVDTVERILIAAYGAGLSPNVRARISAGSGTPLVAERDGAVAGFVTVVSYGTCGYVGSMAVDPASQRAGVGRALMTALLARCDANGPHRLILDATDAGAPLYEQFGFTAVDRTFIYERDVTPGEAMHARVESDVLDRAIDLDARLLECDRANVLAMLAREANGAVVVGLGAYAMVRDETLGPWIASNAEAARDVFADMLVERPHVRKIFVPESNASAQTIVESAGFHRGRALRHMTRGGPPLPRAHIFGQASLGHG